MNDRQTRHAFDEEVAGNLLAELKNILPEIPELIEDSPINIDSLFGVAFAAIADSEVYRGDTEITTAVINIAKDLGLSIFRNETESPKTYMDIGEDYFEVATEPSDFGISPNRWTDSFYAAILSRDEDAIKELLAVPEEITAKSADSHEGDFAFMRLLKGIYNQNSNIPGLVEAAIAVRNYENIFYLDLYKAIFSGDNAQFHEALQEALSEHEEFYDYEYPDDVTGWISIPIICACIIAQTMKGYKIEVESDYIPEWMIAEDFSPTLSIKGIYE